MFRQKAKPIFTSCNSHVIDSWTVCSFAPNNQRTNLTVRFLSQQSLASLLAMCTATFYNFMCKGLYLFADFFYLSCSSSVMMIQSGKPTQAAHHLTFLMNKMNRSLISRNLDTHPFPFGTQFTSSLLQCTECECRNTLGLLLVYQGLLV